MANSITCFANPQAHYAVIETDATGGLNTASFVRPFRVMLINGFVTTAIGGSTITISRVRGAVVTTLAVLNSAALGPAPFTTNIDQSIALFQSGDTLRLTASAAGTTANIFFSLLPFSL